MAKRESSFKNMVFTLFAVTFIASAALGLVYEFTKKAIEISNFKKQAKAIKAVLPAFEKLGDSYKVMPSDEKDSLEFFPAYNAGNELVGTAVKTYTNKGFSGYISIMTGFTPDGTITGYQVLQHQETPGLGSKMNEWFRSMNNEKQNIIGKNPDAINFTVSKDGGGVDAITAATISSRAFLDAVKRAYTTYTQTTDANSSATYKPDANNKGGEK